MKSYQIGLGFDDIILDSSNTAISIVEKMLKKPVEVPFTKENMVPDFISEHQYKTIQQKVYLGHYSVEPIKDAIYYLKEIVKHGCILRVLTNRSGEALDVAKDFFVDNGLSKIPVIVVGPDMLKTNLCFGLDLFIDDDLESLISIIGEVKHLLLFDQPKNRHCVLPGNITRVYSWYDIYDYIWKEMN